MLKTLAAKHQSTVTKMAARHKAKIETPHGLRTCFEARVPRTGKKDLVARFGGIPLKPDRNRVITDPAPVPAPMPRKELIHRLRAGRCELCGQNGTVAVHQVAKLTRLGTPGPGQPAWAALMARETAQDPGSLPALPRSHPRSTCHQRGVIAGEPDARKAGQSGSEGGCAEKTAVHHR